MKVEITDVFLRDGLQDEPVIVSTAHKLEIAEALIAAGIRRIEAASFVNPKRVPQMADAAEVISSLPRSAGVTYTSLALNGRGIERAVDAGATDIQVVTSASQAHSNANAGQAIEDALASLASAVARFPETRFVAGISTAFTCPFEGSIDPDYLLRVVRAFKDMGINDVGLADTLGTTPTEQVMASMKHVHEAEPDLTYYPPPPQCPRPGAGHSQRSRGLRHHPFRRSPGRLRRLPLRPRRPRQHRHRGTRPAPARRGHETGIDEERLADAVRLARDVVDTLPGRRAARPRPLSSQATSRPHPPSSTYQVTIPTHRFWRR